MAQFEISVLICGDRARISVSNLLLRRRAADVLDNEGGEAN